MANVFKSGVKWYQAWIWLVSRLKSPLLLIVRLLIGYTFLIAGQGKIDNHADKVADFTAWHVPNPDVSVYLAGYTEQIGGILLMAGFLSRLITIPLIFTMAVAYATAHIDVFVGFTLTTARNFSSAPPFACLVALLFVLSIGPGMFSVDALIKLAFGIKDPAEKRPGE